MKKLFTLLFMFAILLSCSTAWGYTIATGFSDNCHERLSIEAYFNVWGQSREGGERIPDEFEPVDIPIPDSKIWLQISDALASGLNVQYAGDWQRMFVTSLALGVRSPDTEGHSVTNLATLREAHTNPAGQYPHFLRSTLDDDDEGNLVAITGSRKHLRDTIQTALAYLAFPPEGQLITTNVYAEFYGRVEVDVWAPAFYLGVAIHTLQDSFSHTVRSDDLMKIRHVMNFIDAVNTGHEPGRDGLAHSNAMDDCEGSANAIAAVAMEATEESFIVATEILIEDSLDPIDRFMDKWMGYEPGCNAGNDFCNSKWASLARKDATGPFIADFFDCAQVRTDPGNPVPGLIFSVGMVALVHHRRRRFSN